ncbi:MAG: hypothetical protein ACQEU4_05510 [Bacillota bacterium]
MDFVLSTNSEIWVNGHGTKYMEEYSTRKMDLEVDGGKKQEIKNCYLRLKLQ